MFRADAPSVAGAPHHVDRAMRQTSQQGRQRVAVSFDFTGFKGAAICLKNRARTVKMEGYCKVAKLVWVQILQYPHSLNHTQTHKHPHFAACNYFESFWDIPRATLVGGFKPSKILIKWDYPTSEKWTCLKPQASRGTMVVSIIWLRGAWPCRTDWRLPSSLRTRRPRAAKLSSCESTHVRTKICQNVFKKMSRV